MVGPDLNQRVVQKSRIGKKFAFISLFLIATMGCKSSADFREVGSFEQNLNGVWMPSIPRDNDEINAEAELSCDSFHRSQISVNWYSYSGDWHVVDEYSSESPFLVRTVSFAQHSEKISFILNQRRSAFTTNGDESLIIEYRFLQEEIDIWRTENDVPFGIPICVKSLFR